MLKTRVIGVVLVKWGIVVQSIGFKRYLPIGKPEIAIEFLDRWGVDEIVVLHIDAQKNNLSPSTNQVKAYARQCQVPLSIGGGITSVNHIKEIIRAGADKVVINSSILTNPEVVKEGGSLFGQQSIVASIDVAKQLNGNWMTFTHGGKQATGFNAQQMAKRAEDFGAGELFINSIQQDGTKQGYDLELINLIINTVNIPVIACGGAGHAEHLRLAIEAGASAVAVGNFFHFTEHSVVLVKQYLNSINKAIRIDDSITYANFKFSKDGRVLKLSDEILEAMRFQYIPEEVI